jgi:uncharacterized coiled-coil protein SlyX
MRFKLLTIAILAVIVVIGLGRDAAEAETGMAQDVIGLDRRISMLEQRFHRVETSISRLEQYVTSQRSTGSSDLRDRELDHLRQEMQRMQLRLNEVECGLLKLDERTASAGNRRGPEPRASDPCRQNPGVPLRLTSRP